MVLPLFIFSKNDYSSLNYRKNDANSVRNEMKAILWFILRITDIVLKRVWLTSLIYK